MTPLPEPEPGAAAGSVSGPGRLLLGRTWLVLVVGAVAAALGLGLAVASCGGGSEPRTIEIVVPAGTAERMAAGEKVVVMPPRLEFTVGDQIRIRNEDSVEQSVGPYVVQAGQELLLRYGKEGTYEGYCPLTEGERYEIVVKAA